MQATQSECYDMILCRSEKCYGTRTGRDRNAQHKQPKNREATQLLLINSDTERSSEETDRYKFLTYHVDSVITEPTSVIRDTRVRGTSLLPNRNSRDTGRTSCTWRGSTHWISNSNEIE